MRYFFAFLIHAAIFGAMFWLSGWGPERGVLAVTTSALYVLTLVLAFAAADEWRRK